jgi:hypothetical protein
MVPPLGIVGFRGEGKVTPRLEGATDKRQRNHDAPPLSTQLGVGASLAVPRIAVARTLAVARRTHHGPASDLRIVDSGDMRGDEFVDAGESDGDCA